MNFSYQPIAVLLTTVTLIAGCTEDPSEAAATQGPGGTNAPPSISGSAPTSVTAGNAYSFSPSASDPDGDSLSFSISNRPTWASFDANTGRLSGTPSANNVGTTSGIAITATDGQLSSSLASFSITVQANNSNSAPSISGNAPGTVTAGQQYTFTPSASDPDGDTLTFSNSNVPSWLTFDAANGQISGTPGSGDVGTTNGIVLSASDGQFTVSLPTFSITVQPQASNSAPTISGSPATSVVQDTAYSFQPTASDGDGDQLTFSIGNQPSWSNFDAGTGQLSGTPSAADVGTYTDIAISVSDGLAMTSLAPFSIDVAAVVTGSAILTWTAPQFNDDNSPLNDLTGFKVYWGTTPGNYPNSQSIDDPTVTSHTVNNLVPNTYYFVATAVNSADMESSYSSMAQKTIP